MTNRIWILATAILGTFGLAACTDVGSESPLAPEAAEGRFDNNGDRPAADEPSIADVVVASAQADEPEFTILLAALQETGLAAPLSRKGQYTVFAPTDAAFGRLAELLEFDSTEGLVTFLLDNPDFLEAVLLYHVAPGRRLSGDVLASDEIPTLQGGKLFPVSTDDGPAIRDTDDATTDALLQVEFGGGSGIDIEASNGIIHIIDQVLLFAADDDEGDDEGDYDERDDDERDDDERDDDEGDDDEGDDDESDDDENADRDPRTIAQFVSDLAGADEGADFTYLLTALQAAELTGALDGPGQFTVFAPNDAAFEAAAAGLGFVDAEEAPDVTALVEYLMANDLLAPVLLYHVAPGRRDAEDVLESERIRTLQGGFLFPEIEGETPFLVDTSDLTVDAEILATDFLLANGVVHVVSQVLLPVSGSDLP